MLAKAYKISDPKRILEVEREGKMLQSKSFGVSFLKREDSGYPRFAFVISKRISKLAVNRIRINRALNEGVRRIFFSIPKGYDFVILAKTDIASKTTEEIMKEIEKFFKEKFKE